MILEIASHENRSFDLQAAWASSTGRQTTHETPAARLQAEWSGPREILRGEQATYTLTLFNSGNSDAGNVRVKLRAGGAGPDTTESLAIGRIAAGSSEVVEVKFDARQDGRVRIEIQAEADGDYCATASQSITVRPAPNKTTAEASKNGRQQVRVGRVPQGNSAQRR